MQIRQGFFSAIIMMICTTFAAALTMSFYEPVALQLQGVEFFASVAESLVLGLMFCLILSGLRALTDKFIKGDIYFDIWTERIGGGVCGLITGITMTGIMALAFQLTSFGTSILGYEPFDKNLKRSEHLAPFYPDDYIVGLWQVFSSMGMGSETEFRDKHDNLLLEAYCWRNRAFGGSEITLTDHKAIKPISEVYNLKPSILNDKEAGDDILQISIRMQIMGTVMDYPEEDSSNQRRRRRGINLGWWRLPATHFRLRCRSRNSQGEYKSFFPVGYIYYEDKEKPLVEKGKNRLDLSVLRDFDASLYDQPTEEEARLPRNAEQAYLTIDWVYHIPKDEIPEAIFFRRHCKSKISIEYMQAESKKDGKEVPSGQLKPIPLNSSEFFKYALMAKPLKTIQTTPKKE